LKLHPSAALAALQVHKFYPHLKLEFYINVDNTPGGASVRNSVRNLLKGMPNVELKELPWQEAIEFRETIASMDLVFQLSATETFCMVAADAIASGVPVVGGPAISWLPDTFKVNIDSTTEAAEAGLWLLAKKGGVNAEIKSLESYLAKAEQVWLEYLGLDNPSWFDRLWRWLLA
jgi:glycosyltransferase involved in cell wall biosynthesis